MDKEIKENMADFWSLGASSQICQAMEELNAGPYTFQVFNTGFISLLPFTVLAKQSNDFFVCSILRDTFHLRGLLKGRQKCSKAYTSKRYGVWRIL